MATFNAPGLSTPQRAGATGNVAVARGTITGNGAGAVAAAGSVLNMLKLPAGAVIHGLILIADVDTASLTVKAGYADVDAVVNDDDAFVVAATSLATAATFVRKNNPAFPAVELIKESYLTITTAGASVLSTTDITMIVEYSYAGSH